MTTNKELVTARKLGLLIGRSDQYVRKLLRAPNAPKPKERGTRAMAMVHRSAHLYDKDECIEYLKTVANLPKL